MIFATIAGTVGRSEVQKFGDDGSLTFSLAVQQYDRKEKENKTQWVSCFWYGKAKMVDHVVKGAKLTAVGELRLTEKNGKSYLNLNCSSVTLQGKPQAKPEEKKKQESDFFAEIPF